MRKKSLFQLGLLFCVGVAPIGCQTNIAGSTLPSPHYLKHYPNYFTEDPPFPLQRERDSMIDPTGEIRRGLVPAASGALPQPSYVPAPMPAASAPGAPMPGT